MKCSNFMLVKLQIILYNCLKITFTKKYIFVITIITIDRLQITWLDNGDATVTLARSCYNNYKQTSRKSVIVYALVFLEPKLWTFCGRLQNKRKILQVYKTKALRMRMCINACNENHGTIGGQKPLKTAKQNHWSSVLPYHNWVCRSFDFKKEILRKFSRDIK